jgi:hypothetical protein
MLEEKLNALSARRGLLNLSGVESRKQIAEILGGDK